ncbi:MAG: hypothetical protein KDD73_00385 [Anaerolineales bacterium]|nr:hypothetical protein [Anaerolineales bacterium]MCB9127913.1 hypothetical protein [Ardenticatenales bacterium]MCB9171675.1 hypothetical protein [Ardenticatenales bacterium]
MSAFVALFFRDGRTATADDVAAALPHVASRGPHGQSLWCHGNGVVAHFALHSTPEAPHEFWPMAGHDGSLLFADARIDNRAELLTALNVAPRDGLPVTDGALLVAAHERWGDEAPRHIVGDYAYLWWQAAEQRVSLVRSALGLRFLYYQLLPDRLVVASSLRAVAALTGSHAFDENWLASFILHSWRPPEATALRDIVQVAPATVQQIELQSGRNRATRFWEPPLSTPPPWRDAEWDDAMREAFEAAIYAAFRTATPVATSLSGGLDSSSINLVAHRMMHDEGRLPLNEVHAYSLRMRDFPDTDESHYRNAAAARLSHFDCQWIDLPHAWTWPDVERWQGQMSTPSLFPSAWMFKPLFDAAHQQGARIKVSGAGGDLITGSEDYALIDAWRAFPWRERIEELAHFRARHLLGTWLHAEAPAWLRLPWVRLRRGHRPKLPTAWVEALRQPRPTMPDAAHPRQQAIYLNLMDAHHLQPFQQRAEIAAIHGLELRMPFYDRRLVALIMAMPMALRIRHGRNRVLFKRAFAQDLPQELLDRRRKADFTHFSQDSVSAADQARALQWDEASWLAQAGWVDRGAWRWHLAQKEWIPLYRQAHLAQWLSSWSFDLPISAIESIKW